MTGAISRRGALAIMLAGAGSFGGAASVLRFVMPAHLLPPALVVPREQLPPSGGGAIIGDGRDEGRRVAVSNAGDGRYLAFVPSCTRRRCRLVWQELPARTPESSGYYECYCDSSRFRIDGRRFEGPAPRNLDRYECVLNERGSLVVRTAVVVRGAIGEGVVPS